jgi:hypothetical protein
MARLTDEQRADLLADLRAGMAVRVAAGKYGCSTGTVSNIARAAGVQLNVQPTKKASAARRDWAQTERLDLINRLFDKANAMLDQVSTELHLQQLTTAIAVMIDKRRLEDGEATTRAEVSDSGEEARERIARRLDELAARRREKGAA